MATATAISRCRLEGQDRYEPHPKQQSFHAARATHARRWFVGGRQSGKTEAGCAEAAWFACNNTSSEGGIFAPSYPHAIVARQRFEAMVPPAWRTWNGQDRIWRLAPSGSVVHLRSLSDPDAPRGLTLDWAWLDECAMYSEEAWQNLRPILAARNGRMWGTSTPRGRNWLWKQAVENPEAGVDFLTTSRSLDNPMFPLSEWEAVKARYGGDSPYFRQEYEGEFAAFKGQALPQFDRETHVRQSDWVSDWSHPRGWDFGFHPAPTVCVLGQYSPGMEHLSIMGCKLWYETHRSLVLSSADFPDCSVGQGGPDCIDPSGAYGRDKSSGDSGWAKAMEAKRMRVKYTRRVSERAGLDKLRSLLHQKDRFSIDPRGENAEAVIQAFELAESDDHPDRDCLKDQPGVTDIIDAIRYMVVNTQMIDDLKVTRH